MSYGAGIGLKWKVLVCSFRISYRFCIFIKKLMSGEHLYVKRWSFGNFRAIDWPSSADKSRNNWATELRLVLNERFLFVVSESYIFLHFHKEIDEWGAFICEKVKYWPFSGNRLPFFCLLHEKKWSYRAEIGLEWKVSVCSCRNS